ncbi:MAG: type II toxin-antitoxin system RelE/ParE family toxin [Pyrinomonadaceae bacterium]
MKQIVYHVEARLDVLEIVEYYEQEGGAKLADRFTAELEKFVELIARRPESYSTRVKDVRRANLRRFPHHVLFRVIDEDTVKILSVKHDSRRPSYGTDRK